HRIEDAAAIPDRIGDLACRNILALPAEGISDAIDEMEKAVVVDRHEIAGAKPGVALGEHVAQDLLLGFGGIGVAFETPAALIGFADAAERLADFVATARDAKAIRVAERKAAVRLRPPDGGGEAVRQEWRNPPDRARLALDIEQREIAFGGRIEFEDLRD